MQDECQKSSPRHRRRQPAPQQSKTAHWIRPRSEPSCVGSAHNARVNAAMVIIKLHYHRRTHNMRIVPHSYSMKGKHMKTVGQRITPFNVVGVKPGFNRHEEDGVSAFERIDEQSFPGKWKIIYFYPKDFTFVCPTEIVGFAKLAKEFARTATPSCSAARPTTSSRSSAGGATIAT